ncbi:unnamed protein product [Arabidopsis halleri]
MSNSKVKCNGWDSSALTKEDIKATWLRKQEGVIKRDRMLKYSRSHWVNSLSRSLYNRSVFGLRSQGVVLQERRSPHMLMESLYTKDMGMRSCPLEHWGDESKSAKSINSFLIPSEMLVPTKVKLRTLQRQDSGDGQDLSIFFPEEIFQPFGAESIGRRELVSKLQWFPALHECDRVCKGKDEITEHTKATCRAHGFFV